MNLIRSVNFGVNELNWAIEKAQEKDRSVSYIVRLALRKYKKQDQLMKKSKLARN